MHCTIRIGRPIEVERYQDRADDRLVLRQITDEVMFEIRELTGQEYRDVVRDEEGRGRSRARRPASPTSTTRCATGQPELVTAG